METKNYKFHVHGMHCKACVLMLEGEIGELGHVHHVKAKLESETIEVSGNFGEKEALHIAHELTELVAPHGYTISLEKETKKANWADFKIAGPVAIIFIILFILLQKAGLVNLVGGGAMSYGTVFVIGIIASLSTCMAVVGGLLLSMSATFAKEGDRIKPQMLFHIGRIVSFFILGGVIGALGSAFALGATSTFILGLIIGLVMLVLGLNLLDIFSWAKKLQPAMPKFIAKHAHGVSKFNHTLTPLLVGIATFFLPCGFTQSMQIYTLSTGSFLEGGLTMLAFALGTLPVLAIISFSSININKSKHAGVFFKSAGLIVILFAIFNIINSLAAVGIIAPVFNF